MDWTVRRARAGRAEPDATRHDIFFTFFYRFIIFLTSVSDIFQFFLYFHILWMTNVWVIFKILNVMYFLLLLFLYFFITTIFFIHNFMTLWSWASVGWLHFVPSVLRSAPRLLSGLATLLSHPWAGVYLRLPWRWYDDDVLTSIRRTRWRQPGELTVPV